MAKDDLVQITNKTKPSSVLRIITVLSFIAAFCGFLIAVAVQKTKGPIKNNQDLTLNNAISEIIPNGKQVVTFELSDNDEIKLATNEVSAEKFYASYDDKGKLLGIAFRGYGQGYADQISILFAYNPYDNTLIGIKVTDSKETPGLGAKIVDDEDFLNNFKKMPLINDKNGEIHEIEIFNKNSSKKEPWQINAIAGATISSRAVANILTQSGRRVIPLIKKNLKIFQNRGE